MKRNLSYVVMLLFLLLTAGFTQCLTRASDRDRAPKREPLVQLPPRTTAQLEEYRQPASVTDSTTRTLDKVPVGER